MSISNITVPGTTTTNLMTVKEVAKMLSVSSATVNKWMKTNGLPYLKLGKAVRFMESDVLAWIGNQRHTGTLATDHAPAAE